MKKSFAIAWLLFTGCATFRPENKAPDLSEFGKNIAAMKSAASPTVLHDIYRTACFELLQCRCFGELDSVLTELGQQDPYRTLCTPASIVVEMRDLKTFPGELPWLIYHARAWSENTHTAYADLAQCMGWLSHGSALMAVFGKNHQPAWQQGLSYYDKGLDQAARIRNGAQLNGICEALVESRSLGVKAILQELRKNPAEIALYLLLQDDFQKANRTQKRQILQSLSEISGSSYALFYTIQLSKNSFRKTQSNDWDWELLKTGFDQLLQAHPDCLAGHNAFAVAAASFEKREVLQEELRRLGYLLDPAYWGGLPEYLKELAELPDSRQNQSTYQPLPLIQYFQRTRFRGLASLQAQDLLKRELWTSLEADLQALKPEDLKDVENTLSKPEQEKSPSYRDREELLKNWKAAHPQAQAASSALGVFYINYGWLARGTGYADTVSQGGWQLFHKRLKVAQDLLFQVYSSGYETPGTMGGLMTVYVAETQNLDSARRLAEKALTKGVAGTPTLISYSWMLQPRWQGHPGDIPKVCDELLRKVGLDDAYSIMTWSVIETEGWEAVTQPGHPMHMDWKRAVKSLLQGIRAGRMSDALACDYLKYANSAGWRQDGAQILSCVPAHARPLEEEEFITLLLRRCWAQGKTDALGFEPKVTYRNIGPSRQKASPKAQVGFEMLLNRPYPAGRHYIIAVDCPLTQPDSGPAYTRYLIEADLEPMVGKNLIVKPWPAPSGGLNAGNYRIRLFDIDNDQKLLHTQSFQLSP